MDPAATDTASYLHLLMGGGGLGGGAAGGFLLSRLLNNRSDSGDSELKTIANKLDNTNELLNELLRSHARLEGILSSSG
jgi:hypothetical protein